jgi:predicted CoA-substrate-specific enzyme activase
MIAAGIDMGLEYVKAVILKDGEMVGRSRRESGGSGRAAAAEEAYALALADAGVSGSDVEQVVATGKGKYDVPFAGSVKSESIATVKGALLLCPDATTAVDIGADENLVSTIEDGKVGEFQINEKCAAGIGLLLESIADRLDLTLDEMSAAPPTDKIVSDGCVTFAELDALSLLNDEVPPIEIAGAVTAAVAARAAMTINDITIPARDCVVLCGGLGKNAAFVRELEVLTGIKFVIPKDAEYALAAGAALLAEHHHAG